jgi:hypothetical protein
MGLRNVILQRINTGLFQGSVMKPGPFPMGLNDMAGSYQAQIQEEVGPVRRLLHSGAQEGLVMTITPEDCFVHLPSTFTQGNNTRLIDEVITLPYQEGSTFYDTDVLTKVISNSHRAGVVQDREVLMIRWPPPMPPTAPDVTSLDESESNISPNALEYDGNPEGHK